ncbi:MAG: DUF192 domain-containing protein [Treponema sp.]|jgi:uncharacterized membrane protein (UPF0127 family)|nr:DUF192 domain-containing protein [Treponema sp.]
MNSKPCIRHILRLFLCLALISANAALAAACASQKLETVVLSIVRADSVSVEIAVEIARTDEERSQGLMHRKELPDGKGMIFVFDRDQQYSFWMKNTIIPLSIAFITSDGRITEIMDMQPLDLNSVRSSRSVRYALEVPQGWFLRAGIRPGDVVSINF